MIFSEEQAAPHILVVDDEQDILNLITIGLSRYGYRVSTARDAKQALGLLEPDVFDAIVTDVMMPGTDGIAFLGIVHQQLPDTPVIIMTGFAQLQMAVNAIKNGAFDFIHKPFELDYLCQVLEKAINYSKLLRIEKNYRIELEEAVTARTAELKAALAQLEENRAALLKAANEKNEFMSTITHEMRTPMNGVIGALELLEDSGLSGAQREYHLLARQAADNMMVLVDRLLFFSDNIARGPLVCHESLDLPTFFRNLEQHHRTLFKEKGLSFEICLKEDLPHSIRCDQEQLSQLVDILLGNALKFTEKGQVRLEAFQEKNDNQPSFRLIVSDTGIGIPSDMTERIFEPFIQVDGSWTRRFGGTGLGLSIARQIASLLGARIWAESTPGRGSSFHFCMPFTIQ